MAGDFLARLGVAHPIVQRPMIGTKPALAAAVCSAGGLGSLACAAMSPEEVRTSVTALRRISDSPLNLNFFAHARPVRDAEREEAWRARLALYHANLGLDPGATGAGPERLPFDAEMAATVAALRSAVVSFHFGLPEASLLEPVRAAGCAVLATATTVREARWLWDRGVDAIIAQGAEAGGHRGMFLATDVARQIGTMALVPQIVDAVRIPVIAAGGIADARGVAAAFALGAEAVQVGTAYLICPEAAIAPVHLDALLVAQDEDTALTNVFTGRPARGLLNRALIELGPLCADAPAFPRAAIALQPLRAAAEARNSGDFSPLWAGQAVGMVRPSTARGLTLQLADGVPRGP